MTASHSLSAVASPVPYRVVSDERSAQSCGRIADLISNVGALRFAIGLRIVLTPIVLVLSLLADRGTPMASIWLASGDLQYYYHLGALSDAGWYPYIHFWMEYPPVFPLLIVGFYRLLASLHLLHGVTFALGYGLIMSVVDIVNLILLYRIVLRARGQRPAATAALIYAASPLVIYVVLGWFDPLAMLFVLAGLWFMMNERVLLAGVVVGLGVLSKLFPGVVVLAAPLLLNRQQAIRFLMASIGTVTCLLAPFALLRSDLLMASFASVVERPPWETLPALLAGDYKFGDIARNRFLPETAYTLSASGLGPLVLVQVGMGLVALTGAAVAYVRHGGVRYASLVISLGLTTFLLGSKGFSPQFAVWLVPMILLAFPDRRGFVYVLLLTLCMAGYFAFVLPVISGYYQHGIGSPELVGLRAWPYVVARTLLVTILAAHLLVTLLRQPGWISSRVSPVS
jgi:hypothetical protein